MDSSGRPPGWLRGGDSQEQSEWSEDSTSSGDGQPGCKHLVLHHFVHITSCLSTSVFSLVKRKMQRTTKEEFLSPHSGENSEVACLSQGHAGHDWCWGGGPLPPLLSHCSAFACQNSQAGTRAPAKAVCPAPSQQPAYWHSHSSCLERTSTHHACE
jgi:hypothetical protein